MASDRDLGGAGRAFLTSMLAVSWRNPERLGPIQYELVARLQELETEHRDREQTLELKIRRATAALLPRSRGLAHEIRHPLAECRWPMPVCNRSWFRAQRRLWAAGRVRGGGFSP